MVTLQRRRLPSFPPTTSCSSSLQWAYLLRRAWRQGGDLQSRNYSMDGVWQPNSQHLWIYNQFCCRMWWWDFISSVPAPNNPIQDVDRSPGRLVEVYTLEGKALFDSPKAAMLTRVGAERMENKIHYHVFGSPCQCDRMWHNSMDARKYHPSMEFSLPMEISKSLADDLILLGHGWTYALGTSFAERWRCWGLLLLTCVVLSWCSVTIQN